MDTTSCQTKKIIEQLPGHNCGLCGQKTCEQFAHIIAKRPEEIEKCVHLNGRKLTVHMPQPAAQQSCAGCTKESMTAAQITWKDSLGREFDFILDSFPNEKGPRETIIPHNPNRTKELDVKVGDILVGRPLGMSCGCPITHCGTATHVDQVNGVIVWCVTGPMQPRVKEHKDLGYYSAEAYEGVVKATS